MNLFITSPGRKWNAHEGQVKVMMGLRPDPRYPERSVAKWPDAGVPEMVVQGIRVKVLSKAEAKELKVFHRARGECPVCHHWMSIGRLHQHAKIHA